jgi:hypothetical protein
MMVVVGMHRSGTSMCSNMLHMLGADMADSIHAAPANAKGHWERPRLVDMNDAIFGFFRRQWGSPSHVLDMPEHWLADPRVHEVRDRAAAWLQPRVDGLRPFGFKDPRTTVLLPFWHQVFAQIGADPRYVFCVRDPAQVARSLHLRDGMERGQAEYRWLTYNVEAIAALGATPACIVPYEAWFDRPQETAARLARHVGLPEPSAAAVREVIDAGLRHDDAAIAPASPLAARLHRAILADAGLGAISADLRAFAAMVREFKTQVQPLLTDMEVMRIGMNEQRRVIGDLQALVRKLREEAAPSGG